MGYRVKELQVQNFKRLIKATFAFADDSSVVRITGDNGAGKTSVVSALWAAIAGKNAVLDRGQDAAALVREGADKAEAKVVLSGDRELRVSYSVTKDGGESVKVWASDGSTVGRKDLAAILSEYTIDPLLFAEMAPKDRVDAVGRLAGIDVDAARARIAEAARARTDSRREAEREAARLASMVKPEREVSRVDPRALRDELEKANANNAAADAAASKAATAKWQADRIQRDVEEMKAKIEEKRAEWLKLSTEVNAPVPAKLDTSVLKAKLEDAESINALADSCARYAEAEKAGADAAAKAEAASAAYDAEVASLKGAVAAAKMPVPGMSITPDGDIEVNGRAFNMLSSSEQIIAATRIAAAANPQLKVVNVKDGSLLDEKTMAALSEMAEKEGFQVFVERVGEEAGHIIIRDGESVAS